jgi:hypothetical protein
MIWSERDGTSMKNVKKLRPTRDFSNKHEFAKQIVFF